SEYIPVRGVQVMCVLHVVIVPFPCKETPTQLFTRANWTAQAHFIPISSRFDDRYLKIKQVAISWAVENEIGNRKRRKGHRSAVAETWILAGGEEKGQSKHIDDA